jgi:prepilin-type N-terminal cleavage/methylation domain-containing protein
MRRRQRRQRGFTLMEIMIAMALAAIVSTAVLSIVRTQLMSFEMNDQVIKTQQNARSAMDFVETVARRACGGISSGSVGLNVAGATQQVQPCLRWYDAGSGFPITVETSTDALEVVYASGTMTALTAATDLKTTLSVAVKDTSSFAVGDYVLIGDFANANLYKIAAKVGNTLTFDAQATTASTPPALAMPLAAGSPVLKASTYSLYVAPVAAGVYWRMLMVDADGMVSANHANYAKVQPAVEGVKDFQVAIGIDGSADGFITESTSAPGTDEWIGNTTGESVPVPTSTAPWNPPVTTTAPQLRQVRLSLILQTANSYPGTPPTLPQFEDRPAFAAPLAGDPRYRSVRMVVAPRAWNLAE